MKESSLSTLPTLPKRPESSFTLRVSVDASALLATLRDATQKAKALKASLDAIGQAKIKVKVE